MPSCIYLTGFESGLHSVSGAGLFAALSGTAPTIDTAVVKDGSYSLKLPIPASAFDSSNNLFIMAQTRIVACFHFRYTGLPSSNVIIWQSTVATSTNCNLRLVTDGTLQIASAGGTGPVNGGVSDVLAVDTWHLVELVIDVTTTAYRYRLRVNGTEVADDATTTGAGVGSITGAKIGVVASVNLTTARNLWFDNVIIGTSAETLTDSVPFTDYWGDGRIISILPGSDGTHSFTDNDFSTGDAGTQRAVGYTDFWLMVDDPPPWVTARSTTDNITQRVIRNTSYVEIKPATTAAAGETASGVRALMAYSSTVATANTAACIIRNSTPTATPIWGDHTGIGGLSNALTDHSETTNFFKGAVVTAPGAGWTKSEIEALRWRVGGAGDITPVPTWQFLMLEVAYPVAVAVVYVPRHSAHDHANPAVF